MKKIITKALSVIAIVFMLAITLISFTACGEVFTDGPSANAAAVGNGGLAVMKGEYLYFVNGFKSKTENYNKNKGDEIYYSSIYRIKAKDTSYIVSNGQLLFDPGTLKTDEETGSLIGAKRLVSKVAGHENSALYIFGDTLYFTTPSNAVEIGSGKVTTDALDIYKINLNGKDLKKIFTISNYSDTGKVELYNNNGTIYGVFYDGTDKLTIYKNGKKLFSKSKVTSLVAPSFHEDYNGQNIKDEQVIFYLEDGKLRSYKIGESEQKEHYTETTPTLIAVKNKKLVYSEGSKVYYINFGFSNFDEGKTNRVLSYATFSQYQLAGTNDDLTLVVVDTTIKTVTIINSSPVTNIVSSIENANLLFSDRENIYFRTDSSIYVVNVGTGIQKKLTGDDVCVFNGNNNVSFDGTNLYYFKQHTNEQGTSVYLERVNVYSNEGDESAKQGVGARLEKDYNDPVEDDE